MNVAVRTLHRIKEHNLSLIAAGVAFYAFLSLFPTLAAMLSIYGLVSDPATVETQIRSIGRVLPEQARSVIADQLQMLVSSSSNALSLSAVVGIVLALWSANKATKGLFEALTIVYGERETRSFLVLNAESMLMTAVLVGFSLVLIAMITVLPRSLGLLGLGEAARTAIAVGRWPVTILLLMIGIAAIYRIGPDRRAARWKWASVGSVAATILWLGASVGLSVYVAHFGNVNRVYGSLGAVIILMLWLFLSAFSILLGGALDASLEGDLRPSPA